MTPAYFVLLLLLAGTPSDGDAAASGPCPASECAGFSADAAALVRTPLDAAEEEAEESEDEAILGHPGRIKTGIGAPTFALDLAPTPSLPSARCWHRTLRGPPSQG